MKITRLDFQILSKCVHIQSKYNIFIGLLYYWFRNQFLQFSACLNNCRIVFEYNTHHYVVFVSTVDPQNVFNWQNTTIIDTLNNEIHYDNVRYGCRQGNRAAYDLSFVKRLESNWTDIVEWYTTNTPFIAN